MSETAPREPRRRRFLPWQQVLAQPSDPGLADDLRELLADSTAPGRAGERVAGELGRPVLAEAHRD